jgi:hypothetical protein
MILDGHHRLLKAINNNIETIKARVLDLSTAPKIISKVCLVIKNKVNLNDKSTTNLL